MPTTNNFPAPTPRENTFLTALAAACRREPLAEKWLLCPSRRVGQQWLESLARAGQPVVNVRLHTVATLALELAGADLATAGRQLLTPLGRTVLAARLLRELDSHYLGGLQPTWALAERLAGTLHDLRRAGLEPADLDRGQFEVADKRRELVRLLTAYRQALDELHCDDEAGILQRAIGRPFPARVLLPADLELTGRERELLAGLPTLPVDEPPGPEFTDAFRAVGEINEVREVLRRCLANGWPLDQVEVLHTDAETYVSRFYEVATALDIPVTFAQGIPVRYSRPGRALAAWLAWLSDDFPQTALVAMIRDGLLKGVAGNLGATLRTVPIGFGRARYLSQLDAQIAGLAQQVAEADAEHKPNLQRRRDALVAVREPVARLLKLTERPLLEAAAEFLKTQVRCVNELDNYARDVLQGRIAELATWLPTGGDAVNAREWLTALLNETRVRGEGPRPGHLYVSGWESGGHSGRPHTFIVGLDANRFPPAGRQDPVLLDSERQKLSGELTTVAAQRARAAKSFARLRARLRGTVTASFAWRSLTDDSESAPGWELIGRDEPSARPSGATNAGDPAGRPYLPTAATAPAEAGQALSDTEWWMWRFCMAAPAAAPVKLVGECFPWLQRGAHAAEQRAGNEFTEFDGFVPEAGPALDPVGHPDRPFSAHRLETIGACPLRYFYRYALHLEAPEELELDADVWLPPVEFGQLLHDVFCRHLRDGVALAAALEENIALWRRKFPPPSEGVLRRDCRRLRRAVRIFETEPWPGRPIDFEADIPAQAVRLADGGEIFVRGRIDRVDETAAGLELWDYKTGNPTRYRVKRDDPFNGGRVLQHAIYIELARAFYGKPVLSFGYYFPTEKGRGEKFVFTPTDLADAPVLLAQLRGLIARGEFHATLKVEDCGYCDYRSVCRDVAMITEQSQRKHETP
ncbi:MAG: ATP-dependent helicase/deoxyribonuclease subunit B [Verrucomicrobiae bacterium]|nr:ATP-dependent helicase/deoxyribonuclease subunit B [Verrucomicrobiae bacterium]